MNTTDKDFDDLRVISGIADKRQQLLRQSLDIHTFLDLATISTDKIEAVVKGPNTTPDDIKEWQRKARELADSTQLPSQQIGEKANSVAKEGEWESVGAFIVEFWAFKVAEQLIERQIRVDQRKIDKKGSWEDSKKNNSMTIVESEQLYEWMQGQLGEKVWPELEQEQVAQVTVAEESQDTSSSIEPSSVEVPTTESPLPEIPRMQVEVTQIRALQPPDIDAPSNIGEANRPFIGDLKAGEPLALEATFCLPEPAVADLGAREIMYLASFYVRNRNTGVTISVGDTEVERLTLGQESYTARLPQAILEPGVYRLGVLVKLRTRMPSINYLEVPMFQVV